MKQAEKQALLDYLDNEAGLIPTRMNAAQGVIAERLGVVGVNGDKGALATAVSKLSECQADTTTMGLAFGKVRDAVAAIPVDVEPAPPGPTPTSFPNRAAFNAWVPTSAQAANLDGVAVHSGFGPAANWYTQADGSITQTAPVVVRPPQPPLPPPGPLPGGIVPLADWDNVNEQNNRRVSCSPGMTYAVRFQVPANGPFADAMPRVQCSAAIVPAGAGRLSFAVSEAPFALPASTAAGGTGSDYKAWDASVAGKVFFVLFRTEVTTDVNVRVLVPTPI
jgi:hypothetical protein